MVHVCIIVNNLEVVQLRVCFVWGNSSDGGQALQAGSRRNRDIAIVPSQARDETLRT